MESVSVRPLSGEPVVATQHMEWGGHPVRVHVSVLGEGRWVVWVACPHLVIMEIPLWVGTNPGVCCLVFMGAGILLEGLGDER